MRQIILGLGSTQGLYLWACLPCAMPGASQLGGAIRMQSGRLREGEESKAEGRQMPEMHYSVDRWRLIPACSVARLQQIRVGYADKGDERNSKYHPLHGRGHHQSHHRFHFFLPTHAPPHPGIIKIKHRISRGRSVRVPGLREDPEGEGAGLQSVPAGLPGVSGKVLIKCV